MNDGHIKILTDLIGYEIDEARSILIEKGIVDCGNIEFICTAPPRSQISTTAGNLRILRVNSTSEDRCRVIVG